MSVKMQSPFSKFQPLQINLFFFFFSKKINNITRWPEFSKKSTEHLRIFNFLRKNIHIFKINQALSTRSFVLLDFQLPAHPEEKENKFFQHFPCQSQ